MKRYSSILISVSIVCLSYGTPVFGQAMKPQPSDAVQFVSAQGSNLNDGLSWGTGKATIAGAIAALPKCTEPTGATWPHCGTVRVAAGIFGVSSEILISSPHVSVRGLGPSATQIRYTGKNGCAFVFTGHSATEGTLGNGLFDLTILGAGAEPGACGLETKNINGFRMAGVTIADFKGTGSTGWLDVTSDNQWNERYQVQAELYDNAIGWKMSTTNTMTNPTYGYGRFDLAFNVPAGGIGIDFEGNGSVKPLMTYSNLHFVFNDVENATAIKLSSGALWFSNVLNVHVEGGGMGLSIDGTSQFLGVGSVEEGVGVSDSVSAGGVYEVLSTEGTPDNGSKAYFSLKTIPKPGMAGLSIGSPSDCGGSNTFPLQICESAGTPDWPFGILKGGKYAFAVDSSGNIYDKGFQLLLSAGTITLTSGAGSHTFSHPYSAVPVCTATDRTSAAAVRVSSTRAGVNVHGNGNDVISWICTPAAN